jgi:hypothetical protein
MKHDKKTNNTPTKTRPERSGSSICSPFVVGDIVDISKWNKATNKGSGIGDKGKVVRVWRDKCSSGIMIKVRGKGTVEIDSQWASHL